MIPKILTTKLARLRLQDLSYQGFGAKEHRYQLKSRLTEPEIARFEEYYQITLPQDYRLFLQTCGNGGAGPYYGLKSLQDSLAGTGREFLVTPFPYAEAWNMAADEATEDYYFADVHVTGTLSICHEGCGHEVLLIVSGPERGFLWGDSRVSDGGLYPLNNPLTKNPRMTFLEWYQLWLQGSLYE